MFRLPQLPNCYQNRFVQDGSYNTNCYPPEP